MSAFVPTLRLVRYVTVDDAKLKEIAELLGIPPGQDDLTKEIHLTTRKLKAPKPGKKKRGGRRR